MALYRQEQVLHTRLNPQQVRAALELQVKPGALLELELGRGSDPREFRGEVGDSEFRIIHRSLFRNSFVPVVRGQVTPEGTGAQVRIAMFVHPWVMAFVVFWVLITAGIAGYVLRGPPLEGLSALHAFALLPLLAPAIAWLGFSAELPKAVELLSKSL